MRGPRARVPLARLLCERGTDALFHQEIFRLLMFEATSPKRMTLRKWEGNTSHTDRHFNVLVHHLRARALEYLGYAVLFVRLVHPLIENLLE